MNSHAEPPTAAHSASLSASGPARAARRAAAALGAVASALGLGLAGRPAPSLAQAPPGQYQETANGNGVLDTKTGLTWQKLVPPSTYELGNALAYCNGLNLDGGGWRLPTVPELSSLVDETVASPGPTIDATWFPGTPTSDFWTSSPYNFGSHWFVSFKFAWARGRLDTYTLSVRCVR